MGDQCIFRLLHCLITHKPFANCVKKKHKRDKANRERMTSSTSIGDIRFVAGSLYIYEPGWWPSLGHSAPAREASYRSLGPLVAENYGGWHWPSPCRPARGGRVDARLSSRTIVEIVVVCSTDGGSPLRPRRRVPTVVANHRFNGTINSHSCRVPVDPPPAKSIALAFRRPVSARIAKVEKKGSEEGSSEVQGPRSRMVRAPRNPNNW